MNEEKTVEKEEEEEGPFRPARLIISGIIFVVGMALKLFGNISQTWILAVIFGVAYIIIGFDVLWGAVKNIIHGELFDECFLMALATIGAWAIGEFAEAVAVMLFYQLGEFVCDSAVDKSRYLIADLMELQPEFARVLCDGKEVCVDPKEVKAGDLITVYPGEKIPLDGIIEEGETRVDSSALTGESRPMGKTVGDEVLSGTVNLYAVIKVKVTSVYDDSTVSRVLALIENSSEKKAKTEKFITKFSKIYTPCVIAGAILLCLVPTLIFKGEFKEWLYRALEFLVVSCPCAIVVSVPLSFFGGIGAASRNGVLIKGANFIEALAKAETVVFDKTGTLTKGTFEVSSVETTGIDKNALLELAAYAESFSTHPIGQSIVSAYGKEIDRSRISNGKTIAGKGVYAEVDGKAVYVGGEKLMGDIGVNVSGADNGGSVAHVVFDGEYMGRIIVSDSLKEESAAAIAEMRKLGVKKTVMLTGDSRNIADSVGRQLNIDEVKAELLPDEKVKEVESLLGEKNRDASVVFVGDGINDAPVIMRADVGVAMGALGSAAAIEAADVVLTDDNPMKLAGAIKTAKKTLKIAKENIFAAIGVKIIILILSALGIANMWIAIFGDVGVLILAVLNALRALKK